ncbi:MAG: hypothetical protein ACE5IG_02730 [Dehalococcoidia bacterium]
MEVEREPISRVLRKIAKGLYYLDTGQVLPQAVEILVEYGGDRLERLIAPPLDKAIQGARRVDLGDGAVTYWRNTVAQDPTASMTWLVFYGDKPFLICTFRPEILSAEAQPNG